MKICETFLEKMDFKCLKECNLNRNYSCCANTKQLLVVTCIIIYNYVLKHEASSVLSNWSSLTCLQQLFCPDRKYQTTSKYIDNATATITWVVPNNSFNLSSRTHAAQHSSKVFRRPTTGSSPRRGMTPQLDSSEPRRSAQKAEPHHAW